MSRKEYNFYVYIMASDSGTLYIGITNNLIRRIMEHKEQEIKGFSKKYSCHKLIYYEHYSYVFDAINREKEIKKWSRQKKVNLIKGANPSWRDLFDNLLN